MPVLDCPIPKSDWLHQVDSRDGFAFTSAASPQNNREDVGPWEPAVVKVVAFQHLGDDWDGQGAVAPDDQILKSAIGLAYVLQDHGVDPPHRVVAGVEGSVVFEWQDVDGTYTEVEIDRPLHAEVMMVRPGRAPEHWDLPTRE